jgi:hypothetical protein
VENFVCVAKSKFLVVASSVAELRHFAVAPHPASAPGRQYDTAPAPTSFLGLNSAKINK